MHYFTPEVQELVITTEESANKLQPSKVITVLIHKINK